jgi:spore maturation protein CgeB
MRKVLIFGAESTFNLEDLVSRAFFQLGWQVRRFDPYKWISGQRRVNQYLRMIATRSYGFHSLLDQVTRMEDKLMSVILTERPEILLVFKGEVFPPKAAERARRVSGVRTVLWFPDDPRYLRSLLLMIAHSFDLVAVSSKATVSLLKSRGSDSIIHLPFACDPNIHRSLGRNMTFDLTFVGSYYPERARILSKVASKNLKIWGPYWSLPWIPRRLRNNTLSTNSYGGNLVEILNRSKITINIHHRTDLHASGKINMRVYEAAGCGTFQLTDKPFGLDEFFNVGREIICYDSPEKLVELADYYLDANEERNEIAQAAQCRAYEDHTYVKRVTSMLDAIE